MANLVEASTKEGRQSITNYIPEKIIKSKTIPIKNLRKWPLFNTVDKNMLKQIKLAYVFGTSFSELTGIFVTNEDEVYSVGCNANGCLGIGSMTPKSSLKPLKVEPLCGKKVKSFFGGGGDPAEAGFNTESNTGFFFAITDGGQIYSWGYNGYGQLALGHKDTVSTPTLVDMKGKAVKCVAAGGYHSLVLTTCGELYGSGYNGHGELTGSGDKHVPTPIAISNNCKIDSIAAGCYQSSALAETGEAFLWGWNEDGQLGTGNTSDLAVPTICNVGEIVKQVACGPFHTMLLTQGGELFTFGNNEVGQLGNETPSKSSTPVRPFPNRIVQEIAVSGDLSTCKIDGEFYTWGTEAGSIPKKVLLSTFHEVFSGHGHKKMHKPIIAEETDIDENLSVTETLERALYAQTENGVCATDVEFIVEGKIVKAHKFVLALRSNYFAARFSDVWNNAQDGPIKMSDDIKVETFWAFLYYSYTDKVYFPKNEFVNIMDLMMLADSFCDTQLRTKCDGILQGVITLENALPFFVAASKCNAEGLKTAAFNFSVSNWEEIVRQGFLKDCGLSADEYKILSEAWVAAKPAVSRLRSSELQRNPRLNYHYDEW